MVVAKDWLGLDGKTCVVSGAGGGIGRVICTELAAAGAKIVALDRLAAPSEETVALVKKAGGEAIAVETDISDEASVAAALAAAKKAFGKVDVLVNNAAMVNARSLIDLSVKDWNAMIAVNLTGYFICSQIFGRHMMENGGGAIVHVSSLSGKMPQGFSGAYSVTKAGVNMLSSLLTIEWGEHGIRSNVVAPAMVRTPLTEMLYTNAEVKAKRESVVPRRRIGAPLDIANAVVFVASDRADYISGQEIYVDGGWSQNMLGMVPRPGLDKSAADKK